MNEITLRKNRKLWQMIEGCKLISLASKGCIYKQYIFCARPSLEYLTMSFMKTKHVHTAAVRWIRERCDVGLTSGRKQITGRAPREVLFPGMTNSSRERLNIRAILRDRNCGAFPPNCIRLSIADARLCRRRRRPRPRPRPRPRF